MWYKKQQELLASKKVLVVGAGGIGCELLKNLVLTGFKNIHVIDLDTIDVSNLNRQFLFRREHVGKSKSEVATAAVRNLQPDTNITFEHGSILDHNYGVTFYKEFTFVMNALDNKKARTHVNRMCLQSRVPLIESGSAGYLGQVTAIVRGMSECFECVPKPTEQKTFPGCTIRNTPSEHIHCTVWAKHLFNQLFGEVDIDDDVSPDMNDEENKTENGESEQESMEDGVNEQNGVDKEAAENMRTWAEKVDYDPERLFAKLFHDDIEYLLKMKNLWKERRRPTPVTMKDIQEQGSSSNHETLNNSDIQKVWTSLQCARIFSDAILVLKERKAALPDEKVLVWDKDDDEAMKFVASCANIRAMIFGIPMKSAFEIKSMAGNIIPAIATTNAMVAGMMVVEALKIASGKFDKLRNVFINRIPNPRGKILMDEVPPKPFEKCMACSDDKPECFVLVNLKEMTVKALDGKVLKEGLSMIAPDVTEVSMSRQIIDSEDGIDKALECKKLAELQIADGCILECDDFMQDLQFRLILQSSDKLKGEEFKIMQEPYAKDQEEGISRKRKSLAIDGEMETAVKRGRTDEETA